MILIKGDGPLFIQCSVSVARANSRFLCKSWKWHVVVYGPEGRALYDVSSSRIKVVEWNQAPNGIYISQRREVIRKFFEGNVPQSVLESLGLK